MVLSTVRINDISQTLPRKRRLANHVRPKKPPNKKAKTSLSLFQMLSEIGDDDMYLSFDPPLLGDLDDESMWRGGEIDYSVGFVLNFINVNHELSEAFIEERIRNRLNACSGFSKDALRRGVFDFLCGHGDDIGQVADAIDMFNDKGGEYRKLVGDADLDWWSLDPKRPAFCRRMAFFRRLSRPFCIKATQGDTVLIHRSMTSPLKILLNLRCIREYAVETVFIQICCLNSLETLSWKEKKFMANIIHSVTKMINSDLSIDREAYNDIVRFVSTLRPNFADSLPHAQDKDDPANEECASLSVSYKQKTRIWQKHVEEMLGVTANAKPKTKKANDTKSCPSELRQYRQRFNDQRYFFLKEHITRMQTLSKRKFPRAGGDSEGSLVYTDAEISLQSFIERTQFMREVNSSFPRQCIPGFSRPRCEALSISEESVKKLRELLFDEDGSLSNSIQHDIDISSKHGYINFANLNCAKKRQDKRWQVPIRKHAMGSLIPTRLVVEQILGGIYDPRYEAMYDLGILIGGTEDQSLHHDVARQTVGWIPEKLLWDEDAIQVTGWEIDRLAYNEAMASPNAPSSILIGMGNPEVLLGVQKDQIVRNDNELTCQVRGGVEGQRFEIVRENEYLVVVTARSGVMFTGDFPHAGVRNVVSGSVEDKLLQALNQRIEFVLQSFNENDRVGQTKGVISVLCNFPNLDKLCRLHCSTEITTGKLNIPANTIGFTGCLANPPDERCFDNDKAVATTNPVFSNTENHKKACLGSGDEDFDGDEESEWKDDDANDSIPSLCSPSSRMSA